MLRVILLALFLFGTAHAAKVRVWWTNPSTNTDKTVLTNLASVTVEWGSCSGTANLGSLMGTVQASIKTLTTVDGARVSTFAFPVGLSPVCLAAYASTSNGLNSALSTVVEWTPPDTLGKASPIAGIIHLEFHHAKS